MNRMSLKSSVNTRKSSVSKRNSALVKCQWSMWLQRILPYDRQEWFTVSFCEFAIFCTNIDSRFTHQMRIVMFQDTASKFTRAESDTSSSVTFSNSGSTPNGSPLGSETEEEANDDEFAKWVSDFNYRLKLCKKRFAEDWTNNLQSKSKNRLLRNKCIYE